MSGLTIYRSSAGSGKTYTLVKEYLLIALQYPLQFSRILAITFTNKATAEMKSRIISSLSDLAEGKQESLRNELASLLPSSIDIKEQSQTVLTNILHHYGNFSISTIDSFFNEIVKSLAHELKLSLRFEIELDTDKIIVESLNNLLSYAGSDKVLTDWLEEFLLFQIDNDKGWNIRDGLIKVARKLFDEEYDLAASLPDADGFKKISSALKKIKSDFEETMQQKAGDLYIAITQNGFVMEEFTQGSKGIAGYIFKISNKKNRQQDFQPNSYALAALTDSSKWLSKKMQDNTPLVKLVESLLFPMASEMYAYYAEKSVEYYSAAEALKRIYIIGILSRLNEEIKNYRDENNVITLNDANRIVRSSVTSSDAPLIFEKTGSFFQHYLVDEFQDTSTVQWENIRPLITEALANSKSALIVGDIKQSIYRWRGGNMDLLHSVAEKQIAGMHAAIYSKRLDVNYRSAKEIIDFNNRFFSLAAEWIRANSPEGLTIIEEAYADQQLHQKNPSTPKENGYIKITFYEKGEGETADSDSYWKLRSMQDVLDTIQHLYTNGFTPGDITILVRSNHEGNLAASFLFENGIHNIISADSLLISTSPQINFLVNCLKLLSDPSVTLTRKEAEWFLFLQDENIDLSHEVFSIASVTSAAERMNNFLEKLEAVKQFPVDDLITLIISHFHLNKKPDAYIQRFQDLVAEYREKNPADKDSFLQWWETDKAAKNCSIIMPESQSAIRIMTIHKSKGLQFPVVLMPFTEWDLLPKPGELLWAKPDNSEPFNQLEYWPVSASEKLTSTIFSDAYHQSLNLSYVDNLNLLYVAFTRAEKHLYVAALRNKKKSVSELIDAVTQKMGLQGGYPSFQTGEIVMHTKKLKEEKPTLFNPVNIDLQSYNIFNWQDKMSLKTEVDFRSSEIEIGLKLHEALAFVKEEKDIPEAISKISNIYSLSAKQIKQVEDDLKEIIDSCRDRKWFTGYYTVFTERDFLSSEGKLLRPDRIMIKDKKAVIVDYKTGEELQSHQKQAAEYVNLLKDCGYADTECWLYYISSGKILKAGSGIQGVLPL